MLLDLLRWMFGGRRNVIREVAEVFVPNAEAGAQRAASFDASVVQQFASEFRQNRTLFDSFVDAINRLPRPIFAFGVIGLFVMAVISPSEFQRVMEALAAVPDPLWMVMGIVITFFFGGRYQAKELDVWRGVAKSLRSVYHEQRDEPAEPVRARDPFEDWQENRP